MAFKLSAILNPPSDPSSPAPEQHGSRAQVASTYEAANTLTALASGEPSYSSGYAYANAPSATHPTQHSPTHGYAGDTRPGSSYGSHATPLEPSPPLERARSSFSSSLQHYHHGSRSPEEQRRESFPPQPDYATQLPPIKPLSQIQERRGSVEEYQSTQYGHANPEMISGNTRMDMDQVTHNREADYGRDSQPAPEVRRPSPALPVGQPGHDAQGERSSATPHIKDEPGMTPQAQTPQKETERDVDADTAKAIAAAANEHGTRVRAKPTSEQPAEIEPMPAKKKAPTAKVGTKKGVARKPPPKKRKLEDDEGRSISPIARQSKSAGPLRGGPGATGKKSNSNTPQHGSSPTPAADDTTPAPEDDEDVADGSDDEVYCICRKPDNHSWMIACDGGCDDWFHGKCVKMREEQGELIDKYICPNCERRGKGVTTWKPGCRRPGCNKPALITKSKQSKYCSTECGKLFFEEKLEGDTERPSKKQKRKTNHAGHNGNDTGMDVDGEEDIGPLGGPLRPGDVKALASASSNAEEFRQLGDGVLSPPATASPDKTTFDNPDGLVASGITPASDGPLPQPPSYTLTPAENKRIMEIADEQGKLTARKVMLRDKERFVKMVVEQATRYAEKQGIKPKDVCGYDSRLAWSDVTFQQWSETDKGKEALRLGTLDVPQTNGIAATEDEPNTDGKSKSQEDAENPGFCVRKRCEQHRQWQKNELTTVRAELVDLGEDTEKLSREEQEVRQEAHRRWKGANGAGGKVGSVEGVEEMRADGWVEVV